MRNTRFVLAAAGIFMVLSAFGASSAAAQPLFVSASGSYPAHGTLHAGSSKFVTKSGHEIDCSSASGSASVGLLLSLFSLLFHNCSTTIVFNKAECNSAGEPKGLISTSMHAWLGYLTNASGETMVGWLTQPASGSAVTELTCEASSFEKIKVTLLGEAVSAVPSTELNEMKKSFKIRFEESSAGVQAPQSFLLPSPLSLMTGVHFTSDITGVIAETTETAAVGEGEATLEGGEEGGIANGVKEPQKITFNTFLGCPINAAKEVEFSVVGQTCEYEVENKNAKESITILEKFISLKLACSELKPECLGLIGAEALPECNVNVKLKPGDSCFLTLKYINKPLAPSITGLGVETKSAPGGNVVEAETLQIVK